jgi:hypothetical protein
MFLFGTQSAIAGAVMFRYIFFPSVIKIVELLPSPDEPRQVERCHNCLIALHNACEVGCRYANAHDIEDTPQRSKVEPGLQKGLGVCLIGVPTPTLKPSKFFFRPAMSSRVSEESTAIILRIALVRYTDGILVCSWPDWGLEVVHRLDCVSD